MNPLATLGTCVLVAVLALAAYDLLVADSGPSDEIARLHRELDALEERRPNSAPVLRQLIALEVRISSLEQRTGATGSGLDLESLRRALKEIRAIDRAERTRVHVSARLAKHGISVAAKDEEAVVTIISRYTGALLAVREEPATGGPGTLHAWAHQAHTRMVEELRALLPEERAQALIDLYPPPRAPVGAQEQLSRPAR